MKKYRNFNPVEFTSYVKFMNETVKHTISNSQSKFFISQVMKDNNYCVDQVYSYLDEITREIHPDYMGWLNSYDWRKIYANFLNYENDFSALLKEGLELTDGKKDNSFLRDWFIETVDKMGYNSKTMMIDMALDFWGWIKVWKMVVDKAELIPVEERPVFEMSVEKRDTTITKSKGKKETTGGKSSKVSRPVGQFTKDGELVCEFSSVNEAINVLNSKTGKEHHVNSIYQSCNKGGSAYGYVWKYLDKVSEIKDSEEVEVKSVVATTPVEDTISIESVEEKKLEKSGDKVKEVFVAYYLHKDKTLDRTREIGRFGSHKDTCTTLGINKGVLSNYLKGRKDSIFWNNEDGLKVRIGVEKQAA